MKRRVLPTALTAALCTFVSLTVAAQRDTGARILTKDQWREDLRHFARELPKRHKNAFHSVSREEFQRAVAELDAAIPSLQDHQIIVGMRRIAARVGDGHTGVRLPPYFKLYPVSLYWFGPDLRIIGAAKEYQAAIGARVVKIGGVDLTEVQARIRTCLPSAENENEWYVLANSPAFINRPEVLHALGIVPDVGPASFTLADDSGKEFVLEITPVAMPPIVKGIVHLGLDSAAGIEPLFRQKPMETFWFTHLQDSQTTYVNFRRYDSLGDLARPLFQLIDRNPPRRLVIDLRQNGGGDFFVGRKHLVNPVKERASVNQKGRLFVIVGRRTFSAAMVNAIDFRKQTNAILVGEPIGERPNSYSENDEMTLPNSRLVVSYSTEYYKFVDEDVPAVMPDHRIDPTWPDFQAGRDPVMEWILSQGR
jgi:peptidase S41-like protein